MDFQFHDYQPEVADLSTVVVKGLKQFPKQLPPKFFYDKVGSQLFDKICEQAEYYVPKVEASIFADFSEEIIACLGDNSHIIEPGAGSSTKIRFLLDRMQAAMYVPMDISSEHLRISAQRLAQDYPNISIQAVCVDHTKPYELPPEIPTHKRVFFYPGSSLGNFKPKEAIEFLHDLRKKAGKQASLLIGIDTKKSTDVLNRAYNDAAGVTAAFNLNVLQRIKTELKADLDLDAFYHNAFYNEELGRIEMHLVSRKKQNIVIGEHCFEFKQGESIHTENSYKYTVQEFQNLATQAGWLSQRVWQDKRQYFSIHLLQTG